MSGNLETGSTAPNTEALIESALSTIRQCVVDLSTLKATFLQPSTRLSHDAAGHARTETQTDSPEGNRYLPFQLRLSIRLEQQLRTLQLSLSTLKQLSNDATSNSKYKESLESSTRKFLSDHFGSNLCHLGVPGCDCKVNPWYEDELSFDDRIGGSN